LRKNRIFAPEKTQSIYGLKNIDYFRPLSISNKYFPKSKKGNGFWTFINVQEMSKIENPKIVLKKGSFLRVCEHNALNFEF
jgi:hypothetical protein